MPSAALRSRIQRSMSWIAARFAPTGLCAIKIMSGSNFALKPTASGVCISSPNLVSDAAGVCCSRRTMPPCGTSARARLTPPPCPAPQCARKAPPIRKSLHHRHVVAVALPALAVLHPVHPSAHATVIRSFSSRVTRYQASYQFAASARIRSTLKDGCVIDRSSSRFS